ncbi:MAG: phosphoribosyltransferase family protein [Lachnospiraceae bacterium]|nr:phosphoribosyltransferase family protein [Lachnospiraceae bacterium]
MDYSKQVKVAKRINNTKRNFVVINENQCKHIPASPTAALEMFIELAKHLDAYKGDHRTLVIGFAETATAIGATVANYLGCDYIQTTRECICDEYIRFSENHSHAPEQKLQFIWLDRYSRIIFVEDEVTTGNTILNLINCLNSKCSGVNYTVASLLNGMDVTKLTEFANLGIDVHYLVRLDNSGYTAYADSVSADGDVTDISSIGRDATVHFHMCDTRSRTDAESYERNIQHMCDSLNIADPCSVLVLGTEECMYPAIRLGAHFEAQGCQVKCHATTRSPICVVDEHTDKHYPLQRVHKLDSVYETGRATYLYNIGTYDKVFIVTDTKYNSIGMQQLVALLHTLGNSSVIKVLLGEVART